MPWPSGLPPAAAARVERQRTSGLAGSLLSAPAALALRSVGLAPVGEVMGCIVQQLGWYRYSCGGWSGSGFLGTTGPAQVIVSGQPSAAGVGYQPYAQALQGGWETALQRMLAEAAALGADGVVGVRLSQQSVAGGPQEFLALGTAVRWVEPAPPQAMFLTELTGEDVAALAQAGWSPVAIAIGLSVAVRHDDWSTRSAMGSSWWNGEVPGLSELLTACRADARDQLAGRARRLGGELLVISSMNTTTARREISDGHSDHVATTTILGTTLRRSSPLSGVSASAASGAGVRLVGGLTVMPLSGSSGARRRGAPARPRNPYGG